MQRAPTAEQLGKVEAGDLAVPEAARRGQPGKAFCAERVKSRLIASVMENPPNVVQPLSAATPVAPAPTRKPRRPIDVTVVVCMILTIPFSPKDTRLRG